MGVYIKGMEMPRSCGECLLSALRMDCRLTGQDISRDWIKRKIPDWCPLVPVPPHGRLIDADALFEKIPYGDIERDKLISRTGAIADVCTWVLSAPTIIEAEAET